MVAFGVFFFARDDGLGLGVSLGVGLNAGFGIGSGDVTVSGVVDGSGVALGAGVAGALGEGLGVSFFFGVADVFRCLRVGIGVGVLTKKSLIFLENDSSSSSIARTGATTANAAAIKIKSRNVLFIYAYPGIRLPIPGGQLYSFGCPRRDSPAENFRWANGPGNPAKPIRVEASRPQEYFGTRRRSGYCRLRE